MSGAIPTLSRGGSWRPPTRGDAPQPSPSSLWLRTPTYSSSSSTSIRGSADVRLWRQRFINTFSSNVADEWTTQPRSRKDQVKEDLEWQSGVGNCRSSLDIPTSSLCSNSQPSPIGSFKSRAAYTSKPMYQPWVREQSPRPSSALSHKERHNRAGGSLPWDQVGRPFFSSEAPASPQSRLRQKDSHSLARSHNPSMPGAAADAPRLGIPNEDWLALPPSPAKPEVTTPSVPTPVPWRPEHQRRHRCMSSPAKWHPAIGAGIRPNCPSVFEASGEPAKTSASKGSNALHTSRPGLRRATTTNVDDFCTQRPTIAAHGQFNAKSTEYLPLGYPRPTRQMPPIIEGQTNAGDTAYHYDTIILPKSPEGPNRRQAKPPRHDILFGGTWWESGGQL